MAGIIHETDVRPALTDDAHRRYCYIDFTKEMPFARATSTPMGNPTGTAGDVNTLQCGPYQLQYHVLGTQTILAPKRTDTGLDISQDQTDNDGVEYTTGCEDPANTVISDTAGSSRGTFKVGTDPNFGCALKLKITDVSGTDDCTWGVRKAEAYQANVDDYDEAAFLNVILGDINIETILNGAATTTTDTTDNWADAATKTLGIIVDSDGTISQDGTVGKVYMFIDGLTPTTLATTRFKFDNAELVQPFQFFLQATTSPGAVEYIEWESGLLPLPKLLSQYDTGAA